MSSSSQENFTAPQRDEVAELRERHAHAARLARMPAQRAPGELSEPDREQYELRMDEYEVQLASYRVQIADYAAKLDAAHHDSLTGAWLRAGGYHLLEQELQRAGRTDSRLSVGFVDVDGLKVRNDTRGHAAGDQALRTVGRSLLAGLRGYDHVIRWGGDEFLCVMPGMTEEEAAYRLSQAKKELAADPQELSISVGVAQWRPGEPADALIARADAALYRSRERILDS